MARETLSGLERVAVLLICLGEEASAKVFEELSDEEVRQVTRAMSKIDHIPADVKDRVLGEFKESRRRYAGLFVKGGDFAKKAISATASDTRRKALLDQFVTTTETRSL